MKPKKAILPIALAAVVLIALLTEPFALSAVSENSEISILFTHDMHSHFEPVRKSGNTEQGGFARMKTVIDDVNARYSGTFLFDAGDFSMGTPYQTIYMDEAPELRMMGRLGYDAATFGNHEFDYRAEGLLRMLAAAKDSGERIAPLVASNIDWERTLADPERKQNAAALQMYTLGLSGESDPEKREPVINTGYRIVEKNGVRAAVFGINGRESDSYAPESGLYFTDPVETAKSVVAQIKADGQYDIIVCLSHSGTNSDIKKSEDHQLASAVPEIDVIVSGHSHTKLEQPLTIGSTYIVSCGEYTDYLGHLLLRRDGDRYRVSGYELIPIDESIEPDPDILAEILGFRELVNSIYLSQFGYGYEQVLAQTAFGFTPTDRFGLVQGEEPLGNLIADAYMYAVEQAEGDSYRPVTVTVAATGLVRGSFEPGPVTVADVFNVSSLGIGPDMVPGYPLVGIYLTGEELKTVAEIDISVSPFMTVARLYMAGLSYTYNPNRLPLNKVTSVSIMASDGSLSELEDERLYRVVGSLYSCQMLGAVEAQSFGLLRITPKDEGGSPVADFEQHIIYDGGRELKEWVALARYLEAFPENDGLSQIPDSYRGSSGRKLEVNSLSPVELLKNPNRYTFFIIGIVVLLAAIIILPVILIVKARKKRRKPAYRV